MNEKMTKLERAADLIAEGVALAYEVYPHDEADLGLGFADTTACEIKSYIANFTRCEAMLVPKPVAGYLLEKCIDGVWRKYEFDPMIESSLWGESYPQHVADLFYKEEIQIGLYPALGDCWWSSSDDWYPRLGIEFDAYHTPIEDPHESNVWGGVDSEGNLWRVTKITIDGEMSEKAKTFFRRFPWVTFDPTCK